MLLRYLSQLYKTLAQSVPESDAQAGASTTSSPPSAPWSSASTRACSRSGRACSHPELADAIRGRDGAEHPERPAAALLRDPRAFAARVRAELHLLVRALANRDWEEAAAAVRQDPADPWPPERFEAALEPYFAAYGELPFGPQARRHALTRLVAAGPARWEVAQTLLDPEDDNLWHVGGEIRLAPDDPIEGPLVQLHTIGP